MRLGKLQAVYQTAREKAGRPGRLTAFGMKCHPRSGGACDLRRRNRLFALF